MPITTFLNPHEKLLFNATTDEAVNELFKELKERDGRYFIQEHIRIKRRWFKQPLILKSYTLYFDYLHPDSSWDIQIINFCVEGTQVSKAVICNYMMGLLTDLKVNEGY